MQLLISFELDESLILPISYLHILQSIVYNSIRTEDCLSEFLHDVGLKYQSRTFKPFTFSWFKGHYQIRGKQICFDENVAFEVRSVYSEILQCIHDNIRTHGIRIGEKQYTDIHLEFQDVSIQSEVSKIKMRTPMCISSTTETGRHYYCPDEKLFFRLIQDNFRRKYTAYFGEEPLLDIQLKRVKVTPRDKVVTKYQRNMITAWLGIYELSGPREYLDFCFHAGLGGRNAQGFGMFDFIR